MAKEDYLEIKIKFKMWNLIFEHAHMKSSTRLCIKICLVIVKYSETSFNRDANSPRNWFFYVYERGSLVREL